MEAFLRFQGTIPVIWGGRRRDRLALNRRVSASPLLRWPRKGRLDG
jgi:hypothetical protein